MTHSDENYQVPPPQISKMPEIQSKIIVIIISLKCQFSLLKGTRETHARTTPWFKSCLLAPGWYSDVPRMIP